PPLARLLDLAHAPVGGTVKAGLDYVAAMGMLNFAAGQLVQAITVTVNPAARYDVSKPFTVNLSDPTGATTIAGAGTGTIANPNPPPRASIGGATVTANPGGPTAATFTVTLTAPSGLPVAVDFRTADHIARAG